MPSEHAGSATPGPAYIINTSEHRAYPLAGKRMFTIGRDTACDAVVNEVSVSRRHAEVRLGDEGYTLSSTGSTPTLLNDVPLAGSQPLQEGDSFTVGTKTFTFTQERLPIAVLIDRPASLQRISSIDERRPTLTFQLPAQSPRVEWWQERGIWVAAALLAMAAFIGYAMH